MHYNYHGIIKRRISNRELTSYEYVEEYNGIKPCLLLKFDTDPHIRPVRSHRFDEYEEILTKYNNH